MHSSRMADAVSLPCRTKCDALSTSGGWIDIDRAPDENPVVVRTHHERFAVASDQFARVALGRRRRRNICVVPVKLLAGEESNRLAQGQDTVGVRDLFEHPRHHPKISTVPINARLNHPFPADDIEAQFVPGLSRKRIHEKPLGSAVALPESVKGIDLREQTSGLPGKLNPRENTQ